MLYVQNILLLLHVVLACLYCSAADTSKALSAWALAAAAGAATATHTATTTRSAANISKW
jgi:hypothetical protein